MSVPPVQDRHERVKETVDNRGRGQNVQFRFYGGQDNWLREFIIHMPFAEMYRPITVMAIPSAIDMLEEAATVHEKMFQVR